MINAITFTVQLALALVFGGMIGAERQWRQRWPGFGPTRWCPSCCGLSDAECHTWRAQGDLGAARHHETTGSVMNAPSSTDTGGSGFAEREFPGTDGAATAVGLMRADTSAELLRTIAEVWTFAPC